MASGEVEGGAPLDLSARGRRVSGRSGGCRVGAAERCEVRAHFGAGGYREYPLFNGRRQTSGGGRSRISREAYVRFCKISGPTRHVQTKFEVSIKVAGGHTRLAKGGRDRTSAREEEITMGDRQLRTWRL